MRMDLFFGTNGVDLEAFTAITDMVLDQIIAVEKTIASLPGAISYTDYNVLVRELKKMLKSSDFEPSKIQESLPSYDQNKVSVFCNAVSDKRIKLIKSCIAEHNSSFGDLVTNFDWRMSLVLGTSTSSDLQYPVLALDMQTLNTSDRANIKNTTFEFKKEQLQKLIQVLENNL